MVTLSQLVRHLDETLRLADFASDCSNNGLQAEGKREVRRAVFGVDACQALFLEAERRDADFIFVHHGMSWGANPRRFTGIVAARLRMLFAGNRSLYAAHLPLDAHPELGNNAELCRIVGVADRKPYCEYAGVLIGFTGIPLRREETAEALTRRLSGELGCEGRLFGDGGKKAGRIAVVSGGGGLDALEQAAESGADLLITGEMGHEMLHPARELGVTVIALGHYASETVGPRAVMRRLRETFDLETEFIDLPTGL